MRLCVSVVGDRSGSCLCACKACKTSESTSAVIQTQRSARRSLYLVGYDGVGLALRRCRPVRRANLVGRDAGDVLFHVCYPHRPPPLSKTSEKSMRHWSSHPVLRFLCCAGWVAHTPPTISVSVLCPLALSFSGWRRLWVSAKRTRPLPRQRKSE